MRKFTKYPSNYVKASTEDTHRTEYALEIYAHDDSPRGDHFVQQLDVFDTLEEAYDSAKKSPLDDPDEFYVIRYIEYERTSDGDWEEVETGIYDEITASTSIKADSEVYKISDNPPMYTNIDFDNMYAELDKEYAKYPNAKGYIDGSIKLHLDYGFITRAEANALRTKYLGDN